MDVPEDIGSGLVGEGFNEVYGEDGIDCHQCHEEIVSLIIDHQCYFLHGEEVTSR
jgi:hypothetical protein